MKSTSRPEYQRFLKNLAAARRAAGLDQAAVASKLGTTQSHISKSETGARRMDIVEAARFAKLYAVSLDDLLAGVPANDLETE